MIGNERAIKLIRKTVQGQYCQLMNNRRSRLEDFTFYRNGVFNTKNDRNREEKGKNLDVSSKVKIGEVSTNQANIQEKERFNENKCEWSDLLVVQVEDGVKKGNILQNCKQILKNCRHIDVHILAIKSRKKSCQQFLNLK